MAAVILTLAFVLGLSLGMGLPQLSAEADAAPLIDDTEALLILPWEKEEEDPAQAPEGAMAVIYCTHASEEYAGETRVNGEPGGVMDVAAALAEGLESYGVTVIFDQQLHDCPSYDDAYTSSLASLTSICEEYPEAELLIDVHRDSAIPGVDTTLTQGDKSYARMMFVVGTNEKLEHPDWETNYAFVKDVCAELEQLVPGITREERVYSGRYNQHMGKHAILVEFGTNENEKEEAIASAEVLAEALCLAEGWITAE